MANGPANMPESAAEALVSDHLLIRSEVETTSPFQAHDVVLGVLLSAVTGFVTKSSCRLQGLEEGLLH